MTQSQTFTCPKCGAPQDYRGGSAPTIQCSYCDTTLIVPEALRTPTPNYGALNPNELAREASKLQEIKKLIDGGNKITAIKLYRETFHVGLREAKDAVEAIERGQNVQIPQFSGLSAASIQIARGGEAVGNTPVSVSDNSGCVKWIVALVIIIVILSVVLPILLSVGAFAALMPMISNETNSQVVQFPTIVIPTVPPPPTRVPTPVPTPQFANVVSEFGGKGNGAGKMEDARAIAVDNNGNVFVAEYIGGRVQVFDSDGKFKTQCLIDPNAATPSIAADRSGNLFVLQGVTITKYDAATCDELDVFPPALGSSYEHIAVGADGTLFATMTGDQKDSIVQLNSSGRATVVVDNAIGGQLNRYELDPNLAVDGSGNFYVLGQFASQVFKFDRTGKFVDSFGGRGNEPGQFSAVSAIAVDPQGRVYVSDNQGVQVFSSDGRYLDVFDIPKSVASGMAFDDAENLWIAAREQAYQLRVDR